MRQFKIFMALLLALTTPVHAQVKDVAPGIYSQGFFSFPNYVKNPNCFANVNSITASGGSLTRTTSSPAVGAASCLIDASSSAQTYKFATNTLDAGLNNQNCEARFTYTGDGSLYKAYVERPSGTKVTPDTQLVDASSNSKYFSVYYPCGTSGSATVLTIEATSASAAAIKVNQAYVGAVTGVGLVDNNSDLVSYAGTLNTSGGGAITLNATGKQDLTTFYQRDGDSIIVHFNLRNGTGGGATGTAGTVRVGLPTGVVVDTTKMTSNTSMTLTLNGSVNIFSTNYLAQTFAKMQNASDGYFTISKSGSGSDYAVSDLAASVAIQGWVRFPVSGWTSQNAVRADVTALQPAGEIMPFAGGTCPTGWLAADGSAVSRTTYSQLFGRIASNYGSGDGSTTFNLPDLRWQFLRGQGAAISVTGTGSASSNNATFTAHGYNRTGVKVRMSSGTLSGLSTATDYWVIVVDANTLAFGSTRANAIAGTKIAISGANSAVIAAYEDPDISSRVALSPGGNTGASVGSYQADDFKSHSHNYDSGANLHYILKTTGGALGLTTGSVTANTATGTQASGGTETRGTNVSVLYCIRAYDLSQMAPVLVGGLSSGSTGALRHEAARITVSNSAAAVAATTSSSWVSVANGASAGLTTATLTGFSSEPFCQCTVIGAATTSATHCIFTSTPSSSTLLISRNRAGAAENGDVQLTCSGPR
jgi:microcystin-dependent protein